MNSLVFQSNQLLKESSDIALRMPPDIDGIARCAHKIQSFLAKNELLIEHNYTDYEKELLVSLKAEYDGLMDLVNIFQTINKSQVSRQHMFL